MPAVLSPEVTRNDLITAASASNPQRKRSLRHTFCNVDLTFALKDGVWGPTPNLRHTEVGLLALASKPKVHTKAVLEMMLGNIVSEFLNTERLLPDEMSDFTYYLPWAATFGKESKPNVPPSSDTGTAYTLMGSWLLLSLFCDLRSGCETGAFRHLPQDVALPIPDDVPRAPQYSVSHQYEWLRDRFCLEMGISVFTDWELWKAASCCIERGVNLANSFFPSRIFQSINARVGRWDDRPVIISQIHDELLRAYPGGKGWEGNPSYDNSATTAMLLSKYQALGNSPEAFRTWLSPTTWASILPAYTFQELLDFCSLHSLDLESDRQAAINVMTALWDWMSAHPTANTRTPRQNALIKIFERDTSSPLKPIYPTRRLEGLQKSFGRKLEKLPGAWQILNDSGLIPTEA